MRSPFPGMDPYLEGSGYWPDFHAAFITYGCDALAERLPAHYDARIDERVSLVELESGEGMLVRPDVAVTRGDPVAGAGTWGAGAAAVVEPVEVSLPAIEEVRQTRIEVRHRPGDELVAVLELLSPANKVGDGRDQYLAKRSAVLRQRVHLVELDLLVGGKRLPMAGPLPAGDYHAIVSRAERRPKADVYAWSVRDRMPGVPIPLRAPDPDVVLDLGALFGQTFERKRYGPRMAYGGPPAVGLGPEALAWAAGVGREARR